MPKKSRTARKDDKPAEPSPAPPVAVLTSPPSHPRSPSPIPVPAPVGDGEYYEDPGNVIAPDGRPRSSPMSHHTDPRWSRGAQSTMNGHFHESGGDGQWEHGPDDPTYRPESEAFPGGWSPGARHGEIDWEGRHEHYHEEAWDEEQDIEEGEEDDPDHGHWPSPNPTPIPVPPPATQPPLPPPNRVRFVETAAPPNLTPQFASLAALASAPSPSSGHDLRLFREYVPTPPESPPAPEPAPDMATAPVDNGMYAGGWKTWANEARKLPKSAKTPVAAPPPPLAHNTLATNGMSHTMHYAQHQSNANGWGQNGGLGVGATTVGQDGWGDPQANASWGTALQGNDWGHEEHEDEVEDEDYDDYDDHTYSHGQHDGGSRTMAYAKTPPLIPTQPSTLGPITPHTRRIVDAGGTAIQPAQQALFGTSRQPKDRLHWAFNPKKDPRVQATMSLIEHLAYEAAQLGLALFLRTREPGALFANAGLEDAVSPVLPLDWLSLSAMRPSNDRILQECTAYNNPAKQVVVFVFLLSKTGNSMAIWRRRIALPPDLAHQYAHEIAAARMGMRGVSLHVEDSPVQPGVVPLVDEEPMPPPKPTKLGKKKKKEKDPNKPKKKKWWQFWKKKTKVPV